MDTWHPGEIAVQERLGLRVQANRLAQVLKREIPVVAHEFLRAQPWVIAAARTAEGTVWVSQLTAPPGFLDSPDPRHLRIGTWPSATDPITPALHPGADVGLLVLEPQSRRRMRINGRIEYCDGPIVIYAEQVYANCPKYIQARRWHLAATTPAPEITHDSALAQHQQAWITAADTFFIGSAHAQAGADASHRGGNPGFVEVRNSRTLRWPDYAGNNLFNTLGNLEVEARASLLFVDFDHGHQLQLTGVAVVLWGKVDIARYPGAQRLIEFRLTQVIETRHACALTWELLERSPFNPQKVG
jgi:predicted pyridoxine 5'-phosphate oxidase superfamily flavin-nucleotide-binding protein